MNGQLKSQWWLSLLLLVTYFGFTLVAGFRGRWNDPAVLVDRIISVILWLGWLVHFWKCVFAWRQTSSKRVRPMFANLVVMLIGFIAVISAAKTSAGLAGKARLIEIQQAIDGGMYEDSLRLLKDWPFKEQRVYSFDESFAKLPQSIKQLAPVFVEIEYGDDDRPTNLGICKNGFGGFAAGIRIFSNESAAQSLQQSGQGRGVKVSNGVYYWWQNT